MDVSAKDYNARNRDEITELLSGKYTDIEQNINLAKYIVSKRKMCSARISRVRE